MDKSKVPIIILVILFLGSSFFTFRFYTESQKLFQDKERLVEENEALNEKIDKYQNENKVLVSQNKDLSGRMREMRGELDRIEGQKEDFRKKYEAIIGERDSLVEQIQNLQQGRGGMETARSMAVDISRTPSDEYWQDMLQEKAQLQISIEDLASRLKERIARVKELERKNEDLVYQLEEIKKIKEEMERKMTFNTRTIEIITKDLVREREDRKDMINEADRLKQENASLAQELRVARKRSQDLEDLMDKTSDEKAALQAKVSNVETIMKEKSLEMSSLQRQLSGAISSDYRMMPKEEELTKAVELPPIVVKSEAQTYTRPSLEGKVLAVNDKERFVIIDLGRTAGIKPGDEFMVVRGGSKIGSLEVIETRQDIAACDIKNMQGVIKEGDIVSFQP